MQVFTKRGMSTTPQLTLNFVSGLIENNFSAARTPMHDYSAQLNGIEGQLSYNVGGSWNHTGAWTPGRRTVRRDGFGGARVDLPTVVGPVMLDITMRRGITENLQRGDPTQPSTEYQENGHYLNTSRSGLSQPVVDGVATQTLGITVGYRPTSWWSHEFGIGYDITDGESRATQAIFQSTSDSTMLLQQRHTDKRSLRYSTTLRTPVGSRVNVTVTVGADNWQSLSSTLTLFPPTLTGSSLTGDKYVARSTSHNAGGFMQGQVGMLEHLFLTYGLRAEWNPNFGAEIEPNYAPRSGVAYTQELGPVTAKLRGSYGRSTRPPKPGFKAAQTPTQVFGENFFASTYGNFNYYLANPELAPEHQQGGEGGLELYWGTRGSLVITRYNQTIDGLIDAPKVDSIASLLSRAARGLDELPEWPDGYSHTAQYQYLNIGSIRNQGWELQGSTNIGPITTRGTYSWTKSRTIGINPKYQSVLTAAQYQTGATFRYLPEHTWALGITYARAQTMVALNVTGTGRITNNGSDASYRNVSSSIRLPQDRQTVTATRFVNFNNSYSLADLNMSHRFLPRVEAMLQVQNLTDRYVNDYVAIYASMGRQCKAGFRIR
jgi:hypothetical protein